MVLAGCKPHGRHTEQHDVFFGIGSQISDLIPQLQQFWPDAGKIHLDAWRKVTKVNGYSVAVISSDEVHSSKEKLFFINLGGYRKGEFDEFHYKLLIVSSHLNAAKADAKQSAFYKHTGFEGAPSHIDDKYGVDVDDSYAVEDILPEYLRQQYQIILSKTNETKEDELHLGYFPLESL